MSRSFGDTLKSNNMQIWQQHRGIFKSAPSSAAKAGRRCFASLAANAVRGPISGMFTCTYEKIYRPQVSKTAPPTAAPRFFLPCMPHTLLPL